MDHFLETCLDEAKKHIRELVVADTTEKEANAIVQALYYLHTAVAALNKERARIKAIG